MTVAIIGAYGAAAVAIIGAIFNGLALLKHASTPDAHQQAGKAPQPLMCTAPGMWQPGRDGVGFWWDCSIHKAFCPDVDWQHPARANRA